MELLDTSLDQFYKFVYHKLDQFIPESVLAYITRAVSRMLFDIHLMNRTATLHFPTNVRQ